MTKKSNAHAGRKMPQTSTTNRKGIPETRMREDCRDKDLMARFCNGDMLAFAELYELYNVRLERFLKAHFVSFEDVQDVLQNAWLRMLRTSWRNYDPKHPFACWLYAQVRSEMSSQLRKSRARNERAAIVIEEITAGCYENPIDFLLLLEEVDFLRASVEKLSDVHREVIELRFFKGLSYEECSDTLRVRVGTISSRQSNAVKQLRCMMNNTI